jgi:hypothetical protein
MAQKNLAEEAIIAFLGTLSKLAQSSDRYMVRDAGAIAPLVALMISGTGEVPARAASVLRDLAQYAANRTAILEAGGIAQLVQMLSTAASSDSTVAVEAADALRSLCEGNLAVCAAVREHGGVKALVAQLKGGHTSQAASVAVAALSQMILADAESRRQIVEQGGVKRLVALLSGGVASDGGGARKRGQEAVNWCETKACEETARAVHELAAEPGCSALLLSAGAVPSLVMLIMRAGAHATSSQLAAAVLVSLLKADDADETALNAVIATLVDAQRTDSFSGHGWSRERGIFTELRSMLHAAAERRLQAVEEGQSAAAIQQAIEVGRAVELPAERLDGARATFDDMQARGSHTRPIPIPPQSHPVPSHLLLSSPLLPLLSSPLLPLLSSPLLPSRLLSARRPSGGARRWRPPRRSDASARRRRLPCVRPRRRQRRPRPKTTLRRRRCAGARTPCPRATSRRARSATRRGAWRRLQRARAAVRTRCSSSSTRNSRLWRRCST